MVQKDNVGTRLDGAHVHVDGAVVLGRELGELEVVRGKQREGLRLVVQISRDAAGQRQAVKGRCAAADLVHQHQRVRRGGVQYLRGLGHLQHEGGLRVGHVIGGTDARVNGVDRPEPAAAGRYIRAYGCQQHDQRDLPHVGGLAAHVGTGDDLHAAFGAEVAVVGNEAAATGFGQARLHHRMATGDDFDARLFDKHGLGPVQRERALGQRAQRIQRGDGARQPAQHGHKILELI